MARYSVQVSSLSTTKQEVSELASLLDRSGVGNPVVLKKTQVEVVANVPGVGANYQESKITIC
jgi:hypothetical protein